ncbi:hypothetical protein T492DRAFT_898464, partial [Pavlovales sp. CCMP2436]
ARALPRRDAPRCFPVGVRVLALPQQCAARERLRWRPARQGQAKEGLGEGAQGSPEKATRGASAKGQGRATRRSAEEEVSPGDLPRDAPSPARGTSALLDVDIDQYRSTRYWS